MNTEKNEVAFYIFYKYVMSDVRKSIKAYKFPDTISAYEKNYIKTNLRDRTY